jgi:two-component system, OmpR family, sensor kinase
VSLRARLVLVVLVLMTVGLVASDIATATPLRSYLLRRVDERLDATAGFAPVLLGADVARVPPPGFRPGVGAGIPRGGAFDVEAARIDSSGRVVKTVQSPFANSNSAFRRLSPEPLRRARAGETVRFNVSTKSGRYRGLVEPIPGSADVAVVLAPLRDVDATMTHLYWIEGIATAVLLLLAGALGLWLVRVGLRPLAHITDTADAVAAGDLDRRVDVSGGPEVARLGRALNSAFDARAASEQSLRKFISDASHELRTPLTSIRGYAELLRAGALQGEAETGRAAARIEHEAARMGGLVDNLLSLARLDESRPLELADLDLAELAADAVADARAVEPDRPIALNGQRPVHVVGDETALRQVFANLLANAREHTPPTAAIEVRVTTTASGARIDVRDEGPGIDPDDRDAVFDRFWRGEDAPRGGSGLGLAIVAAVADAHGGTAWEGSGDDHVPGGVCGAHFVVELPARPPA